MPHIGSRQFAIPSELSVTSIKSPGDAIVTIEGDLHVKGRIMSETKDGAMWVAARGDLSGPRKSHIPPWCEGASGPEGLWAPCGGLPNGDILWRRLIVPYRKPTPVEELAEVSYEGTRR